MRFIYSTGRQRLDPGYKLFFSCNSGVERRCFIRHRLVSTKCRRRGIYIVSVVAGSKRIGWVWR